MYEKAYPKKNGSAYSQVHVLLLNWEDDDLGTYKEIDDLRQLFQEIFFYNVEQWSIPSTRSGNTLESRIIQFREDYDSPSNLLIVYYGGHGASNKANKSIWVANERKNSPDLDWSSIQPALVRAESDVFFLLDCCYAATAATRGMQGQKEILAACSVESMTTGVGDNSFTSNVIDELRLLGGAAFNVTTLHSKLMERRGREQLHQTPVHASLSRNMEPSIILTPYPPPPRYQQDLKSSAMKDNSSSTLASAMQAPHVFARQLHNADTRVLISVRLKASTKLPSAEQWQSYLVDGAPEEIEEMAITLSNETHSDSADASTLVSRPRSPSLLSSIAPPPSVASVPASLAERKTNVKRLMKRFQGLFVKSEKAFGSHSTLLLISVPIPIWDFLPDNGAYSFVGFIRSDGSKAATPIQRSWSIKIPSRRNSMGPILNLLADLDGRYWWVKWCFLALFILIFPWLWRVACVGTKR